MIILSVLIMYHNHVHKMCTGMCWCTCGLVLCPWRCQVVPVPWVAGMLCVNDHTGQRQQEKNRQRCQQLSASCLWRLWTGRTRLCIALLLWWEHSDLVNTVQVASPDSWGGALFQLQEFHCAIFWVDMKRAIVEKGSLQKNAILYNTFWVRLPDADVSCTLIYHHNNLQAVICILI